MSILKSFFSSNNCLTITVIAAKNYLNCSKRQICQKKKHSRSIRARKLSFLANVINLSELEKG